MSQDAKAKSIAERHKSLLISFIFFCCFIVVTDLELVAHVEEAVEALHVEVFVGVKGGAIKIYAPNPPVFTSFLLKMLLNDRFTLIDLERPT